MFIENITHLFGLFVSFLLNICRSILPANKRAQRKPLYFIGDNIAVADTDYFFKMKDTDVALSFSKVLFE